MSTESFLSMTAAAADDVAASTAGYAADVGDGDDDGSWNGTTTAEPFSSVYPTWAAALIVASCSIIIVGTVIGNTLVCTAVSIVRKLRTPSNWLIVSLAVADLLVAVLVMPLAVVYEIKGYWPLNRAVCDAWTSLDVLLCTASILNLCMISVDRYFVITRPFQYAIKRTPARMAAMILSVWILSALISIPPLFGWRAAVLPPRECELSQEILYQFYATIGAFYLPLVVMIIIYVRIYQVSKRISVAEAKCKPRKISHGHHGSGASDSVFFGSGKSDHQHMPTVNSKSSFDGGNHGNRLEVDSSSCRPSVSGPSQRNNSYTGDANNHHSHGGGLRKNLSFLHRSGSHRLPSAAKDTKATKTLGVIMGAFTVCWLPFFILALIKPFCNDRTCIPEWLNSLFLWLGFANSLFNPMIYARFNRDFRTPFKEILLCRCHNINRRLRSESYAEQYGSTGGTGGGGGGGGGGFGNPGHHSPSGLDGVRPPSLLYTPQGRPASIEVPLSPTAGAHRPPR